MRAEKVANSNVSNPQVKCNERFHRFVKPEYNDYFISGNGAGNMRAKKLTAGFLEYGLHVMRNPTLTQIRPGEAAGMMVTMLAHQPARSVQ